jgi:hypothetical protein
MIPQALNSVRIVPKNGSKKRGIIFSMGSSDDHLSNELSFNYLWLRKADQKRPKRAT